MLKQITENVNSNAVLLFGFIFASWVVLLLYRAGATWVLALFGVLLFAGWLLSRTGIVGNSSEAAPESTEQEAAADPVERLKRRYADGEISESEFERRLDTLLQTEERIDLASTDERLDGEPTDERLDREPTDEPSKEVELER